MTTDDAVIGRLFAELGRLHEKSDRNHQETLKTREIVLGAIADHLECRRTCQEHAAEIERQGHVIALLSGGQPPPPPAASAWRPDPRDSSGPHDIAVLAAEHRELVESRKWWRQETAKWAAAVLAGLIIAGTSGCVAYVAAHIK